MVHLVYCDHTGKKGERELDRLIAGTKTMIIRGAAGRKIPHSRVFAKETLYLMEKGTKLITAKATVKAVKNYERLSEAEIDAALASHQAQLQLTEKQKVRWHKKFLCLVEVEAVEEIEPLAFDRQGNMDDWLMLEKIEDVVVGTSIPFNYAHARLK